MGPVEHSERPHRVAVLFGTRPEVLKLAPVVLELRRRAACEAIAISTGQHRDLVKLALGDFGLDADLDLDLMEPEQQLFDLSARVLAGMRGLLEQARPDVMVVQGDTTSAAMAALGSFYGRCPVAHVEAGLRSGDMSHPFPEELNRRLISIVADLHFAPTTSARDNLLAEGVPAGRIFVTGNTIVDALHTARGRRVQNQALAALLDRPPVERFALVTSHRRENHGKPLEALCRALLRLLASHADLGILFPVHPSPQVRNTVQELLGASPRVFLLPALAYVDFVSAMEASYLIVSDSGGVQEEAPVLGKPVEVFRQVTERPEAVEAKASRIVGVDEDSVVEGCERLLADPDYYRQRSRASSPFGDGKASRRIVDVLSAYLDGKDGRASDLGAASRLR